MKPQHKGQSMATSIDVQGEFCILSIKTTGDDGEIHRRSIQPGSVVNGAFVKTDLSGEAEDVAAVAQERWTPELVAAWEVHLVSSQYVPPVHPPLDPWQFRAMLDIGGIAQTVNDAIAAISDPVQRTVAKARLDYSLSYNRNDPLVAMLAPIVGLTDAQIDALWSEAAQLIA
jgi:hypothetical protein